jgi:hypothetical protein
LPPFGGLGVERRGLLEVACSLGEECAGSLERVFVAGRDRLDAIEYPWAVVPGVAGGTSRQVPYSAVEAGIIARNEALGLNPSRRPGSTAWRSTPTTSPPRR